MPWTVSITGKGGVGKTTLAALTVRWLAKNGYGPVLAVDADPNSCLDLALGVRADCTVGGVREEAKQISQGISGGGMGKQELLDLKVQESLVESDDFDLIAMGRPEGPGCYCYANNVLRGVLDRLTKDYPSVAIDNEAGLENLSRRTVQETSWLLYVTDASMRGLTTARRLYELAREMGVKADNMGLVVNRARDNRCLEEAGKAFTGTPVQILAALPEDEELARIDEAGDTVFALSERNPLWLGVGEMLSRITEGVAVKA